MISWKFGSEVVMSPMPPLFSHDCGDADGTHEWCGPLFGDTFSRRVGAHTAHPVLPRSSSERHVAMYRGGYRAPGYVPRSCIRRSAFSPVIWV